MNTAQPAGGGNNGGQRGRSGFVHLSPDCDRASWIITAGEKMAINSDDFPRLAMVFAQEVLGWDKAVFHGKQPHRMILKETYPAKSEEDMFGFDFGQIDDIHRILRQWCKDHEDFGFTVRFTKHGNYVVTIQNESISPPQVIIETEEFESAGHAMATACLKADRILREAS
jgi:hypothetical protein